MACNTLFIFTYISAIKKSQRNRYLNKKIMNLKAPKFFVSQLIATANSTAVELFGEQECFIDLSCQNFQKPLSLTMQTTHLRIIGHISINSLAKFFTRQKQKCKQCRDTVLANDNYVDNLIIIDAGHISNSGTKQFVLEPIIRNASK